MTDFSAKRPAWQRPLNAMMRGMLGSPVLAKATPGFLLLLHVVGRKSGRRMDIPVAAATDGADRLIGTPFGWGANLVDGGTVEAHAGGVPTTFAIRRFEDAEQAVPILAEMCRQLPTFRGFMQVTLGADGQPDLDAVRAAQAAGVVAFRLTPAATGPATPTA